MMHLRPLTPGKRRSFWGERRALGVGGGAWDLGLSAGAGPCTTVWRGGTQRCNGRLIVGRGSCSEGAGLAETPGAGCSGPE